MTIIAGFKTYEGIVLCADTQETVSHAKRKVPKIRFEPSGFSIVQAVGRPDLALAVCGAGYGPLIDKLADESWKIAQGANTLDEACEKIEKAIKDTHAEYGLIYQAGLCPEADLIYGVKMEGCSRLFTAHGPIVNEKKTYDCGGQGGYMADFMAQRMYEHHLDIYQCVILAAYVLFQAKEHVDGCGGDSHIVVLRDDGSSGHVDAERIKAITKNLRDADREVSRLLLTAANIEQPKEDLASEIGFMQTILEARRDAQGKAFEDWQHWRDTFAQLYSKQRAEKSDSLGLPVSSGI